MALSHIGANKITDLASATEKGAIEATRFYTDTVKEVSRAHDWNFLKRRATLRRFGRTPAFEWSYRWALPSDFLALSRYNGVKTSEPEALYEIESFEDSFVTNGDFSKGTYDSDAADYLVDDWTDASTDSGTVLYDSSGDYMKLTPGITGIAMTKQLVHALTDSDHVATFDIQTNTGSGVVQYFVTTSDGLRTIATTSTSAGHTGTTTLNFYTGEYEVLLWIKCETTGAVVSLNSAAVTCATAPDRVLLSDSDTAQISYVANLTDTTLYDPKFTECLALLLGSKLAIPMRQDESLKFSLFSMYEKEMGKARRIDGNEEKRGSPVSQMLNDSEWIKSRRYSTNG